MVVELFFPASNQSAQSVAGSYASTKELSLQSYATRVHSFWIADVFSPASELVRSGPRSTGYHDEAKASRVKRIVIDVEDKLSALTKSGELIRSPQHIVIRRHKNRATHLKANGTSTQNTPSPNQGIGHTTVNHPIDPQYHQCFPAQLVSSAHTISSRYLIGRAKLL